MKNRYRISTEPWPLGPEGFRVAPWSDPEDTSGLWWTVRVIGTDAILCTSRTWNGAKQFAREYLGWGMRKPKNGEFVTWEQADQLHIAGLR